MIKALVLILAGAIACNAQTAKAVVLKDADAAKLSAAYKAYKDAEAKYEEIRKEMKKRYAKCFAGVEFSEDFRVALPKSDPFTGPVVSRDWPTWCPCQSSGISAITNNVLGR